MTSDDKPLRPAPNASLQDSSSQNKAPDLDILGKQLTIHPSGYTETSSTSTNAATSQDGSTPTAPTTTTNGRDESEQSLIDQMARFRTQPLEFLREVSLHVSGTGWRSYDRIVGQPIFYPGFSEKMKSNVLAHPMLQAKVKQLAGKRVQVEAAEGLFGNSSGLDYRPQMERRRRQIEKSIGEANDKIVDDMICKMESKRFIRTAYWFVAQLLLRMYHQGVHVSSEEVLRLRAVASQAAKQRQSIIFLPCHRSHIDYVSLQIICYRLGLALPTVVAGDNLNFPLVGPFLQHAGAMWIRRSFGDDQLYTTIVQSYMDTLLANGFNVECFIEGGRSRTGKLLPPKFGILGFLLESVYSGRVKDAIVCPVSTQYDKVLEVDSYINELLGQQKKKENLADFLSSSSALSLKLGRVDVRFHEPWSLRQFIDEQQARFSRMGPQMKDSNNGKMSEKVRLLRTLGYRVLKEINDVSVVMPSALIGTILLTLRGRGVGKSELIRRVELLSDLIRSRGGRVAQFASTDASVIIDRTLQVLGPNLVGVVQGLAEETYYAVDRFQLSFYRNMTIHLFILEALTCAGMYLKVKQGTGREHQRISYDELRAQVSFLSQLFRGEFIFPTEGLETNLGKTLKTLESERVVTLAHDRDSTKIEYIELSDAERESGRENYDFYCFLIWPFIEASWLGAVSLMMLTPPLAHGEPWLELNKVQNQAQLLGKTLYHQGDLSYFEAVNKETLKNAYSRFEEEGIIIVTKSRDKNVPVTVRLADDWTPSRDAETGRLLVGGKLWNFADLVSQSRREGKNRRDGATVATRVLGLADKVGRELFLDAAAVAAKAKAQAHQGEATLKEETEPSEAQRANRRRRGLMQSRARL